MKEKTKVLSELLKLTEQQHAAEKQEWTNKSEPISQLIVDNNELVQVSENLTTENREFQESTRIYPNVE